MLGYRALVALVVLAYYYVKVKPQKLPPGPPDRFLGRQQGAGAGRRAMEDVLGMVKAV